MSIKNYDAFGKNAEILKRNFPDVLNGHNAGDLPHREAMQLMQNELDAVKSYTVQINGFISTGDIGSMELVYVLVAMQRTLRMLKSALKKFDPDALEKYKHTLDMCDTLMETEEVIVPKGDADE